MKKRFDDYNLLITDSDIIKKRFTFPGVMSDDQCFLRLSIQQGTPVFLCAQLKKYTGTSITNAAEEILLSAIRMLVEDGVVVSERKRSFRDFFSAELFSQKRKDDLIRFFSERAVWIEYYPAGTGIASSGSYAIVKFDSQLTPSWSYVSKETAIRASGRSEPFFDVPDEDLRYGSR